jgi:hypothetical protein
MGRLASPRGSVTLDNEAPIQTAEAGSVFLVTFYFEAAVAPERPKVLGPGGASGGDVRRGRGALALPF